MANPTRFASLGGVSPIRREYCFGLQVVAPVPQAGTMRR